MRRKELELNENLWNARIFICALCAYSVYGFCRFPVMALGHYLIIVSGAVLLTAPIMVVLNRAIDLEKKWFLFQKGFVLLPDPSYLPAGIYHAMVRCRIPNSNEIILHLSAVNLRVLNDMVRKVTLGIGDRTGYLFYLKNYDESVSTALKQEGDISIVVKLEWDGVIPKLTLHEQSEKLLALAN